MAALKQPTIRVVAIITGGVPESDTKQLIAYARTNNKLVTSPAMVGAIQASAFRIGDTAGTIDNIIHNKLCRPGSVRFVSESGGMSNEVYNSIACVTDEIYEGTLFGILCCGTLSQFLWYDMFLRLEARFVCQVSCRQRESTPFCYLMLLKSNEDFSFNVVNRSRGSEMNDPTHQQA